MTEAARLGVLDENAWSMQGRTSELIITVSCWGISISCRVSGCLFSKIVHILAHIQSCSEKTGQENSDID